jgi:SAM-dependent methyltransferase
MVELLSPLRRQEHKALSEIVLEGSVLDLGGSRKSKYQSLFRGEHTITTVNFDEGAKPEILHDLETPLPTENDSYDNVLLINVLEHIYNYKQLVTESFRVLKSGGQVVVAVPFMFPEHPSPSDFHRFTKEALKKVFTDAHFSEIEIKPLGTGVIMTNLGMLDRLMPYPIRIFTGTVGAFCAYVSDWLFYRLAKLMGKKYDPHTYALGYILTAKK